LRRKGRPKKKGCAGGNEENVRGDSTILLRSRKEEKRPGEKKEQDIKTTENIGTMFFVVEHCLIRP
jgi:hypothetical protein